MTELNRRDAAKLTSALALGAAMSSIRPAGAQEPAKPPQAAVKSTDEFLERARQSPEGFMLSAPQIFALDVDGYSRDLVITSARNEKGDRTKVHVPSRSVRIFRADPTVDEFTSQGGLYWRFRDKPGKVMLNKPADAAPWPKAIDAGEIVMVVRDEDTVRCYTMTVDLRC